MSKKVEKVSGTVEVVVDPRLDVADGAFVQESIEAIKNPTMKKAVVSYVKAVNGGRKAAWDVAKACARMKVDIRKEFGSDERLADFLGFKNKGQFSKVYRTGIIASKLEVTGITQSNAQELLPLCVIKDGKLEDEKQECFTMSLDEFIEEAGDLSVYSQKELRKMVTKCRIAKEEREEDTVDDSDVQQDVQEDKQEDVQEEREVEWIAPVKIDNAVLEGMEEGDVVRLKNALRDVCISFKIGMGDIWVL